MFDFQKEHERFFFFAILKFNFIITTPIISVPSYCLRGGARRENETRRPRTNFSHLNTTGEQSVVCMYGEMMFNVVGVFLLKLTERQLWQTSYIHKECYGNRHHKQKPIHICESACYGFCLWENW